MIPVRCRDAGYPLFQRQRQSKCDRLFLGCRGSAPSSCFRASGFCAAKCKETVRVDAPVSSGRKRDLSGRPCFFCATTNTHDDGLGRFPEQSPLWPVCPCLPIMSFMSSDPLRQSRRFSRSTVTELIGCVCMPWGTKTFGKETGCFF